MKNKTILIVVFIIVAAAQLYVPASMIIKSEGVINKGTEYKFKVAPVDPNDPFRGKYITLSFDADTYYSDDSIFSRNQQVFVVLTTDDEGYASIDYVLEEKPYDNSNYVKAKVNYLMNHDGSEGKYAVDIDYPFNRFYMEESKASAAETLYRNAARDSNMVAYALVSVNNGEAVLQDVLINDISLQELVGKTDKQE